MSGHRLRADLTPLRTARDFRLLYASRTVIALGTQATEVALLVQAKQLTGSTVAVGLLGAVELVPLVVFGLYGGVLADRFDRRRLILACEAALGCLRGSSDAERTSGAPARLAAVCGHGADDGGGGAPAALARRDDAARGAAGTSSPRPRR